jgi:CHAD domain-containing protein
MDRKAAHGIIKEFVETTQQYFNSDSYSSGYLTSTVLDLLETAEPHRAMEVLAHIERNTKEYEKKIAWSKIKEVS